MGADVASSKGDIVLRATERQLLSPGYMAVYATAFFRRTAEAGEEAEEPAAAGQSQLESLQAGRHAYITAVFRPS